MKTNNLMKMKKESYLLKHSRELSEKYPGKCVAIINNKLVAVGRDRIEAYKKAKKKYPKGKLSIFYMPTDEETITLLIIE